MPSMAEYFGPSFSSLTKVEGFSGPFGFSATFTGLSPRSIFFPAVLFETSFSLGLLFLSSAFLSVAFLSTESSEGTAFLVVLLRFWLFAVLRCHEPFTSFFGSLLVDFLSSFFGSFLSSFFSTFGAGFFSSFLGSLLVEVFFGSFSVLLVAFFGGIAFLLVSRKVISKR